MRTQVLFVVSLSAILIVPAIAIHIGGFLAYLGMSGTFVLLTLAWRRALLAQRLLIPEALRRASRRFAASRRETPPENP